MSEPGTERLERLEPEPEIYDVAELPESEKGGQCPLYDGEDPERCTGTVEYVVVYEKNLDPDDDRRDNYRCCADCKPRVTADDGLRADGGTEQTDTERCAHCGKEVTRRNGNPFLPFECPIHGDMRPKDLDSWENSPHGRAR